MILSACVIARCCLGPLSHSEYLRSWKRQPVLKFSRLRGDIVFQGVMGDCLAAKYQLTWDAHSVEKTVFVHRLLRCFGSLAPS